MELLHFPGLPSLMILYIREKKNVLSTKYKEEWLGVQSNHVFWKQTWTNSYCCSDAVQFCYQTKSPHLILFYTKVLMLIILVMYFALRCQLPLVPLPFWWILYSQKLFTWSCVHLQGLLLRIKAFLTPTVSLHCSRWIAVVFVMS